LEKRTPKRRPEFAKYKEKTMRIHESFKRQESRGQPQSQPMESSGVSTRENGKESKTNMAYDKAKAIDEQLMERICERENLNQAYRRVVSNGGAPGIDGMKVEELKDWLKTNGKKLQEDLLKGRYKPQAIRSVAIPKSGGGGQRRLGIPTVVDRFVQQGILQILNGGIDRYFDESSYGYRPKRSAHQAVRAAQQYVEEGYGYVAEVDIEKYFDTVNHDMVMGRLAQHVEDKRVLKIVRRYLQAGMWQEGVYEERRQGTTQGGPLSPLLANLLLDDLDKELRRRGHKFCRYADDCNIYLRSKAAAERVLGSVKRYLEEKLKLRVNEQKSQAGKVSKGKFLGYTIRGSGILKASKESVEELKERVRYITRRKRSQELKEVIKEVNEKVRGWRNYFQYDKRKSIYEELDSWIKRRLRSYRLKQKTRYGTIVRWLISLGVERKEAIKLASSGKGWWRLSKTVQLHMSMNNKWFKEQGLVSLAVRKDV
jgi:RNA-directed DNA polymerase